MNLRYLCLFQIHLPLFSLLPLHLILVLLLHRMTGIRRVLLARNSIRRARSHCRSPLMFRYTSVNIPSTMSTLDFTCAFNSVLGSCVKSSSLLFHRVRSRAPLYNFFSSTGWRVARSQFLSINHQKKVSFGKYYQILHNNKWMRVRALRR